MMTEFTLPTREGKRPKTGDTIPHLQHSDKSPPELVIELMEWFVMIKDAEGRFKDNDLWGSGWGWALYEGDDRKTQVASDYRSECRTCHVPARKNDWIFTQCYALLKKKE